MQPAQVDPARLLGKRIAQRGRQGGGLSPVQLAGTLIPHYVPVSEDDQDPVWRRFFSHHANSRSTHTERAASGDAITTSHLDEASARSIDDHSPGLADKLAVSRKISNARGRYHGLAKRSIPYCSAGAGCRQCMTDEMNPS